MACGRSAAAGRGSTAMNRRIMSLAAAMAALVAVPPLLSVEAACRQAIIRLPDLGHGGGASAFSGTTVTGLVFDANGLASPDPTATPTDLGAYDEDGEEQEGFTPSCQQTSAPRWPMQHRYPVQCHAHAKRPAVAPARAFTRPISPARERRSAAS